MFIFQENSSPGYLADLESTYSLCKADEHAERVDLEQCDIDRLESVDVVISNRLPYRWRILLSDLKIVSVVFDEVDKNDNFADIYIDYLYERKHQYFVGENYSIISPKKGQDISFSEIFNLISMLEWDTNYWGFPVAILRSKHLSENILYRVNEYLKNERVRLVEYLCNCHDNKSVHLAEANGYEFKDIRLTFEKDLEGSLDVNGNDGVGFGVAETQHIPTLREISRDMYLDSRYYYDNNFDNNKVRGFYMDWVEKAVRREFDDECFTLVINRVPVAYCSIRYEGEEMAYIGLFGVDHSHAGKGLGRKLIHKVCNTLMEKGNKRLRVVTQGRNYPAQRLYQRCGFLTFSTELWYHKWIRQ